MKMSAIDVWKLDVGVGPAEHGVYVDGYLYLAPTFRDEFWKVDPETGAILDRFRMPGHVWGAPLVDGSGLYGASTGGDLIKFRHDGVVVWRVNTGLDDFIAEAVVEAWGKCLAVQYPKGIALVDKAAGEILWVDEWSPEAPGGQEPTFDQETGVLWVCRPTAENGLVAYDAGGEKVHLINLPSPPTTYACPQIWSGYIVLVCRRHLVVLDRGSGRILWVRDFSTVNYGGEEQDSLSGGPRTLTHNGRVMVWTADGVFTCISISSGEEMWRLDFKSLGFASAECSDPWGYAGGAAVDGVFVILGRNNLPEDAGSPFSIDRNRLFMIDYNSGEIVYVSKPVYQMACCCKPIVAKGKVVIGSWYKDSEERTYRNFYNCWRIVPLESEPSESRVILDRDYAWLGGPHHGGYSRGCLLGVKKKPAREDAHNMACCGV
ncbi:MAG: PQQ-binding-like beta-propeller repeat protein [Candidatus Bathyarchaeia archaeon]